MNILKLPVVSVTPDTPLPKVSVTPPNIPPALSIGEVGKWILLGIAAVRCQRTSLEFKPEATDNCLMMFMMMFRQVYVGLYKRNDVGATAIITEA